MQARAALLPSVNYGTSFIYTQPNGLPSGVFIANNGAHEYISQGDRARSAGIWFSARLSASEGGARSGPGQG